MEFAGAVSPEAWGHLGRLARAGDAAGAAAPYREEIRWQTDNVDARFNYGVALARSGRYTEAATEFCEALRLHPQHPLAQKMLDEI